MKAILNYCEEHSLNFDVSYDAGVFTMIFYSIEDEFREEIPIPTTLHDNKITDLELEFDILSKLSIAFSMHTVEKMAAENGVENDDIPVNDSEDNCSYFQKRELKLGDVLPQIGMNDIQINDTMNNDDRMILISKDYRNGSLSNKFLNAEVAYIQNDEDILDTVVIGISFVEDTDDSGIRYNKNWRNEE